jgi:hypothetical protein
MMASRRYLTIVHHGSEVAILLQRLKADEIHAPLPVSRSHHGIARGAASPTEVPGIEPVPVLKLVPGLPPAQEIVVAAVFLVETPLLAQLQLEWQTRCYQGDLTGSLNTDMR